MQRNGESAASGRAHVRCVAGALASCGAFMAVWAPAADRFRRDGNEVHCVAEERFETHFAEASRRGRERRIAGASRGTPGGTRGKREAEKRIRAGAMHISAMWRHQAARLTFSQCGGVGGRGRRAESHHGRRGRNVPGGRGALDADVPGARRGSGPGQAMGSSIRTSKVRLADRAARWRVVLQHRAGVGRRYPIKIVVSGASESSSNSECGVAGLAAGFRHPRRDSIPRRASTARGRRLYQRE